MQGYGASLVDQFPGSSRTRFLAMLRTVGCDLGGHCTGMPRATDHVNTGTKAWGAPSCTTGKI